MTDDMTPEQISRRTTAAFDAAVGAGRDLGLDVADAKVLYELFSVVVHLAPSPVVARIPVVLPGSTDLDSLARRQQEELDVSRWLADQGVPVTVPSPLVPREPVRRDGFSMTFWAFVEEDRTAETDYVANAATVPDLHAVLRSYPGSIPFLSSAEPWFVTEGLERLGERPDLIGREDLDRARREWRILEPLVSSREAFEKRFPGIDVQTVHGDCPAANIMPTVDGALYADFEMVTSGPVEWDMASLGPEFREAYDRGARSNDMRPLDEEVMRFVDAVGALRTIAFLSLTPHLPDLAGYLLPMVEQWRRTPFAAGLEG
ncbi:phosphotransferase [Nocardiopsis sp. LDBS1602]|uniref:phosphotransferase n=1 Tax=Nocardiopsis sp. LDBS1602 TaxID=3109597 RepID=UPI002DBCEFDD|nr:phosphotransferase [Nocardiopsis sp. LDBS1602]MEC3891307.1 phosphotransferase [Nocardiopsis sp. LDBS1602]